MVISFHTIITPYFCFFEFLAVVVIFQFWTTDGFSTQQQQQHPLRTVAGCRGTGLPSGSSLSFCNFQPDKNQYNRQIVGLSATNTDRNNEKAGRFYELISVEDADKMLQQERLIHQKEIRELKDLLDLQHKEIWELNGLHSHAQLPGADVDMGFVDSDIKNDSIDDTRFSTPSSTVIDDFINDDEYKQQHRQSHNAAERRTLEIELHQIDEENEELENEFNDRRHSHQNEIDEFQRIIYDVRDRSDCIRQELKLEFEYFERARVELEEMVNQEGLKVRQLEQQLLLARREQEILEKVAIDAKHQQQERQDQEEQERRQRESELEQEDRQRQSELEQEGRQRQLNLEQEDQQRQLDLEQEDYHREQFQWERDEQLRQEHQELVELDRNQAEFDKTCATIFNEDRTNRDINDRQTSKEPQHEGVGVDGGGQGSQQHQYSVETTRSQCTAFAQYGAVHQQTVAASVKVQKTDPPQAKRTTRKNSDAHGIFMNFNDILM
mmetsp:Transcript_18083/g.39413  ORF Transcript_18083/g.39413 Transcript_18083/m.39413 type:complete len:495 (-) Transcript_18083:160-1644(-)